MATAEQACEASTTRRWPGTLQVPDNIEEKLLRGTKDDGPKFGWCLLCDQPILREEDFIPETDLHRCVEAQRLFREHSYEL